MLQKSISLSLGRKVGMGEGGSISREGGSLSKEGGSLSKEGGSLSKEGGSLSREGGSLSLHTRISSLLRSRQGGREEGIKIV